MWHLASLTKSNQALFCLRSKGGVPPPILEARVEVDGKPVRKLATVRENFKYYFADFVRKGVPPPLYGQNFRKKKVTDLGGTPPSPFTDIPPKKILQKVLKMVFFAQKTPVFGPKNRLRIWGVPPLPPLRTFPRKKFFKKC